jgi:hypothetical protein
MELSKTVIFCTPEQYETDVRPMLLKLGYLPEAGAMNPMQPIHVGVIVFGDGHFNLCVDDWAKIATDYQTLSHEAFVEEAMSEMESQAIVFLRERGFAVMNAWTVRDVTNKYPVSEDIAIGILEDVLEEEAIMSRINEAIEDKLEEEYPINGCSLEDAMPYLAELAQEKGVMTIKLGVLVKNGRNVYTFCIEDDCFLYTDKCMRDDDVDTLVSMGMARKELDDSNIQPSVEK